MTKPGYNQERHQKIKRLSKNIKTKKRRNKYHKLKSIHARRLAREFPDYAPKEENNQ